MTTTTTITRRPRGGYLDGPTPNGVAEVVDLILSTRDSLSISTSRDLAVGNQLPRERIGAFEADRSVRHFPETGTLAPHTAGAASQEAIAVTTLAG